MDLFLSILCGERVQIKGEENCILAILVPTAKGPWGDPIGQKGLANMFPALIRQGRMWVTFLGCLHGLVFFGAPKSLSPCDSERGIHCSLSHIGGSQRGARAGPDIKGEQRQSGGATQTSWEGGGINCVSEEHKETVSHV